MDTQVYVYLGADIANYGFGDGHPFSLDRHGAFVRYLETLDFYGQLRIQSPVAATEAEIMYFHTPDYLERVKEASRTGRGFLDAGDTPAFVGAFEAASAVVGTTLAAVRRVMSGVGQRAFVPIAGLHHARPNTAGGFCIFNDCAVAAEALRQEYGLSRVAYVDIDAHHGDGMYYGFEADPLVIFADTHEDGRFLYPGSGSAHEVGIGDAAGTKLNIPLAPGAGDEEFLKVWETIESHLIEHEPEFVLLQCGADSLAQDPLTHLRFSPRVHAWTAQRLCHLADRFCQGRIVAMGGGGYNLENVAHGWTTVVKAMMD